MNQKLRKFVIVLATILAILSLADFIYAHAYRSLANGIGFSLLAYGNYKASPANKFSLPFFAMLIGLAICITTLVLDFLK